MKILKNIILALFVLFSFPGYAQTLSSKGNAHKLAAETLAQSASTGQDYMQIAEEYEKILNTDPGYSDAYLKAAHAYAMATPEIGKTAYDKGLKILNRLRTRNSSFDEEIYAETITLEAMLGKHNNGPSRLYGTWGQYSRGKFYPFVKITQNGYSPDVEFLGYWMCGSDGKITDVRINISGNICYLEYDQYWDNRPALRKKGWSNYVEDCDSNADSGFPTSGVYKYDESRSTYYYKINLSKLPLTAQCIKIHNNYYYRGSLTYADTDLDTNILSKNLQKQ